MKNYHYLWLTSVMFFLIQYMLRATPTVLTPYWIEEFNMTQTQLASMGSLYLISYALLQIPFGVMLYKFGTRKILITSIIICFVGIIISANATNFSAIQLGRILIGIGSSPAFVCCTTIVNQNFPLNKKGLFIGLGLTIGIFGGICVGYPLNILVEKTNWRTALNILSLLCFMLIWVCYFLPKESRDLSNNFLFNKLGYIIKNTDIRNYILISVVLYIPFSIILDIWGMSFLTEFHNVSKEEALFITSLSYFMMAVGAIIFPLFYNTLFKISRALLGCFLLIILILTIIFLIPFIKFPILLLIFLVLGIASSGVMLCYCGIAIVSKKEDSSITFAYTNAVLMSMEGGIHFLIGNIFSSNYCDVSICSYGTIFIIAFSPVIIFGTFAIFQNYFNKKRLEYA